MIGAVVESIHIVIFSITTMYNKIVVFVAKCKKVCYINNVQKRYTKRGKVANMTVRDLYIYSKEGQTFILFMDGETEPCFKGDLEYCPPELINRLVYQYNAIDFNMIEVILI